MTASLSSIASSASAHAGSKPADNSGVVSTKNAEGIATELHRIYNLSSTIERRLRGAVQEIGDINLQTRLLSFNAQIEAAHAGAAGRAFEVVAREMVTLSERTTKSAADLDEKTQSDIRQLNGMIGEVGTAVRGTRLSDLAFTNIDLIDRNLYERSCDVRWWATDSSCVEACLDFSRANHASQRLSVILDAYTVYQDIVLCDMQGRVIANGRPAKFSCLGSDQSSTEWFRSALRTGSGGEFGFEGVHQSSTLAGRKMALVYSALVRRDGRTDGEPIGCLGIVFDWEALAQTIVNRTQVGEAEKRHTRACIVDRSGLIIADSRSRHLKDKFPLGQLPALIGCGKGYCIHSLDGIPHLMAYAHSPGFETYSTGWHSFIVQPLVLH